MIIISINCKNIKYLLLTIVIMTDNILPKLNLEKFNLNRPFLLIDSSYMIFHRFFALRLWYKKSHKEEIIDEHKWLENETFMEKLP